MINMKGFLEDMYKNSKLEIFSFIGFIIIYIFRWKIEKIISISKFLEEYFDGDRLSGIADFFAITIGIYIAVITILATSRIGITKEMLIRKLDTSLVNVVIAGMIENLVSVGIAVFVPLNEVTRYVLIAFLTIAVISFVKFIILLILIFKANMSQMARDIDNEEEYQNSIIIYLEKIDRYLKNRTESK